MSDGIFLCCPFFPPDALDEIWDLIESVSKGLPTYCYINNNTFLKLDAYLISVDRFKSSFR